MNTEGPAYRYTPERAADIEKTWQQYWTDNGTFNAPNPIGDLSEPGGGTLPEDRVFVQDMFPYPSGVGLHVGHPLGYIATDVFARFNRKQGKNVLHTLGYDAFGLPAEQYAVQTGTHPRTTTQANIDNMERQLGRLGLGHDKRRSVATTDKDFYRWTQWIFLQIYNAWFDPEQNKARPIAELEDKLADGSVQIPQELREELGEDYNALSPAEKQRVIDEFRLVYRSNSMVNWAPGLGTVLANEEVTSNGKSERGNFPVFRKNLQQWMMRITAYSDRLIDDLEYLDWPEKVKSMQRNWIGRSVGAEVNFESTTAQGAPVDITVFTTRPDTLFGASYIVLAPENEMVDALVRGDYDDINPSWTGGKDTPAEAVKDYRERVAAKTDLERQESKEKTGVFTGAYATNPVNGEKLPVFIADYVLPGYGTGAVMAVPAHDDRDFQFATVYDLPKPQVISGAQSTDADQAYTGEGTLENSSNAQGLDLNGMSVSDAKDATIAWLEQKGKGAQKTQYKLRDWLFARQRYWGEPFPIVYDADGVAHALPDSMLPLELPEVEDYKPVAFDPDDKDSVPQPPLAKATDWINVELDLGEGDGPQMYRRDANVMPQWAGSSWYQLRYIDPDNEDKMVDPANEQYWTGPREGKESGGVDLYVGGMEHAVLHLLYARFWQKVLYDLGYVSSFEPYHKLFNQGYIQAYAYTDDRGVYVPAEDVVERDGAFYYTDPEHPENGEIPVTQEYGKMGKSLKNAVSPDEIADQYGADTLRVYEMTMGPLDTSRPWATKDVVGSQRFLQRAWRLVVDEETGDVTVTDAPLTEDDLRQLHKTIQGVGDDYANLRPNTAVSKMIEYVNYLTKTYSNGAPRAAVEPLVHMLSPVAPHIAEEMNSRLGGTESLTYQPFPDYDEQYLVEDTVEIPVQVQGKVRGRVYLAPDASNEEMEDAALNEPAVKKHIDGKEIIKVIVVPGRLVNVVVK